ncbi:MAG: hypothetical protein IJJ43_08535 [Oscillospiraceae bacterium]|nr:hypothetical protein [Oscillospiraceae bacterium]
MNNQNKKKKKSGGAGAWFLVALVVLLVRYLNESDGRELQRFFWRVSHGRVDPVVLVVIGSVVLIAIIVAVSLAANKRLKSAEQRPASPRAPTGAQQHSHDRIQGYTAADENEFLHWKKQLDGFLAAGLIDRKEYNALLERRKTSYIGK